MSGEMLEIRWICLKANFKAFAHFCICEKLQKMKWFCKVAPTFPSTKYFFRYRMFLAAESFATRATAVPTKAGVSRALASHSAADGSKRALPPSTRLALS